MVSGLEPAVGRAVAPIVKQAAGRLREDRKLRRARDRARPLMAKQIAENLVGELEPGEGAALAEYLVSPEFEHVALQVVISRSDSGRAAQEEMLAAAREQLRHGIRLATALPPDRLFGITDLVLSALSAAAPPGSAAAPDAGLAANQAHLTAMAARNGALLARLPSLTACHDESTRLRAQVAAMHADLRVPHTGLQRSVPWDQLYVSPALTRDGNQEAASPLRDLLQAGQRMVVLGDPGAGKSTLAEKLAYDIASDPACTEVPFLVVLRHLSTALQAGERTLAEHLVVSARDPHNVGMSPETVDYLLLNGRAVVILDGLDELTDVSLRRRLAELVRGFVLLYPTVPVLVTSRRVGYSEAPLDGSLFQVFALAPFSADRVETYVRHWFQIDDSTPAPDRSRLAESFLRESSTIEDLRSNPLLLTLLCAMYSADHYIPRLRSQIYERCALLVFERWDGIRGISRAIEFEGRVRGAVQALAWELFTGAESEVPRHRIMRVLIRHLVSRGFDEDDAAAAAQDFLEYCAGRAWVLAEVGSTDFEPIYGFAHRTFMEYFAAEHLVRHHPTPEAVWAVLAEPVLAGDWEVVAQLALQLLDRNVADGAERLVHLALNSAEDAGTDRAMIANFCARALGHVCVSPATMRDVTRLVWDCATALPEAERFKLVMTGDDMVELDRTDGPLYQLLFHCLPGNLAYLRRGLAERLGEPLRAGDPLAFLLLDNVGRCYLVDDEERRRYWTAFIEEQRAEHRARYTQWCETRPWSFLRQSDRIDETLDRHGPEPFYLSDRVMVGATYPLVLDWFRSPTQETGSRRHLDDARHLAERLMAWPTPWMPKARWIKEFTRGEGRAQQPLLFPQLTEMDRPRSGADLGAFLVLSLPYLEMARDGRQPAVDFANKGMTAHLLGPERHLALEVEVPARMHDFLVRWRAGDFRVLA